MNGESRDGDGTVRVSTAGAFGHSDGCGAPPPPGVTAGHVFTALAHPRRRYLLYALCRRDSWPLMELAEQIAAWERDCSLDAVTERDRNGVYVSLFHAHVSLLENEAVVEFDEVTETVSRGPRADEVLSAFDAAVTAVALEREGPGGDDGPAA